MRRLLFLVIAAMGMFKGHSQALVQTYTDRCTGEVKVFTVDMNGSTVVAYYNRSRVFTAAEFTNGTLQAWLEETYAWWQALSPCSTGQANTTTTQQTTTNATTNATNAANNATSNATNNTGTTNTTTNGNTGSTNTGGTTSGSTSSGSTSGSSSSGSTGGDNSNTSSSGGDSSSSSSSSNSSGGDSSSSGGDNSGGDNSGDSGNGDSGGDSSSSGGDDSSGDSSSNNDNSSSDSDNSSGDGDSSDGDTSGEEGGDTNEESGESNEDSSNEENSEEGSDESSEENSEEENEEVEEESKEEEKEEESKEEEKEEEEEEQKEESTEEEEEEEEEEKKLAPPILSANLVTMSMIDGMITQAASFGYSQSSLTGEDTYSANAMVWSNLKQYSINLSKSHVFFNWDKEVPVFIIDPDTKKAHQFGSYMDRGSIMYVQSLSVGYMRMFSTHIATAGISNVYMGQKDNFWKGFVGGFAVNGMGVFLEGGNVITTAALTAFGTKPFPIKNRLIISPMLAYSMSPVSYDFQSNEFTLTEHGTYIIGSNFDFTLSQRFKANIGGNVIGNTQPGIPLSWALTVGSRFQF